MEAGVIQQKGIMKVEVSGREVEVAFPEVVVASGAAATTGNGVGGLARQGSMNKNNCLCSPTTHAGSFRCRLHRAPASSLHRTKSIDSTTAVVQDSQSKPNS